MHKIKIDLFNDLNLVQQNLINIESDLSNTCIAGFATRQVKFAPLSAEVTG